jgi:2-polyprenyl-3-methyl-5-hydroxy-6-metoxy-1,4-benzoquinol methylase
MLRFENQLTCPVCGNADPLRKYEVMSIFATEMEYLHCSDCGILWQTSRLADDYIGEYYRDVYRELTSPSDAKRATTTKMGKLRASIQVGWMSQFLLGVDTALDYGCSGGWLLDALADYGLTVCGVEMDRSELTQPARDKYKVYDSIEDAPGQYDLITISHVVEHFNHPVDALKSIVAKLKPGGLLFVEVPNSRAYPGFAAGLHHPICFDAPSLARTLGMAGMEVLEHEFHDMENTPMHKNLMMAAIKPKPTRQRRK